MRAAAATASCAPSGVGGAADGVPTEARLVSVLPTCGEHSRFWMSRFFIGNGLGQIENALLRFLTTRGDRIAAAADDVDTLRKAFPGLEAAVSLSDEAALRRELLASDVIIYSLHGRLKETRDALRRERAASRPRLF